jgi:protein TonB
MPGRRRVFFCAVATAHAAALFGLVQCQSMPMRLPRVIKPFEVAIVSEPSITPPQPQPRPLPRPQPPAPPTAPTVPLPEVVIAAPPPPITVAPTPPASVSEPPAASAAPAPASEPVPPTPPAAPAPPSPPPVPKRVSPEALRYAVPPPDDFPVLSRRLNETGKVLLRVVFDVDGHPRLVALARSSGFTRLDEQALASMRKARIHPCKENGVAIECELVAALVYELED